MRESDKKSINSHRSRRLYLSHFLEADKAKGLTVYVDSLYSTYLVSQFMMSYDDITYLVNEIMTYDV